MVAYVDKAVLDVEGIAEMAEVQALFVKRMERLRAEGKTTAAADLDWEVSLVPDFSGMTVEERHSIEAEIEEKRADPEFRAELKRSLEGDDPGLARLMDEDDPRSTPVMVPLRRRGLGQVGPRCHTTATALRPPELTYIPNSTDGEVGAGAGGGAGSGTYSGGVCGAYSVTTSDAVSSGAPSPPGARFGSLA